MFYILYLFYFDDYILLKQLKNSLADQAVYL